MSFIGNATGPEEIRNPGLVGSGLLGWSGRSWSGRSRPAAGMRRKSRVEPAYRDAPAPPTSSCGGPAGGPGASTCSTMGIRFPGADVMAIERSTPDSPVSPDLLLRAEEGRPAISTGP